MCIGRLAVVTAWFAALGLVEAQTPPSPYAAISGVVLNDATGGPIRRAIVTLSTLDTPPLDAVTFTESNGAFGFTAIPPGKYQLHVDMEGFQHAWFGASTPRRPPGTLALAAGDVRFGITFRLRPVGSISGVVLDPDGDPVPSAQIRLLKAGYERRKPNYAQVGFAVSDDLGRYRLDAGPGQYIVMAAESYQAAAVIQPEAAPGQAASQKWYAVQFYPDASRMSSAAPVSLAPGKDLEGIDFHLTTRAAAPLHGKVVLPDDVPANSHVQIGVFPQDVPNSRDQIRGANAFAPNFEFEILNLTAGPYVIVATLAGAGRHYRAMERIELPPAGQSLTLHLDRAIDLTGRVDLEGGGERPSGPLRVTLISGDFPPVNNQLAAEMQPDGSFTIPNVVPGIWDIGVEPVPRGGYIKAMLLGDRDVLTEDMTIAPNTRESLRIVVSTRGAVVTGTVAVPENVPRSPRASVLLAPSGKYEHVLNFYAVAAADDSGHFEFKGVTPGRYKLYAFEEMEPAAYDDPGFLKPFEKQSEAFDVAEGAHVKRQTQLILAGAQPAPEN
ncbi:MAG: carboxypeptidase regulatory-like domain-containing protein [Bryobacteraceae bacterium]|jgi:protocatechuate 3,4-dioxygenase beta subunit